MIAVTSPWLWYGTRATAVVGLVLLTASAILGIFTNARLGWKLWPRWATREVHRRSSILALVFITIHVATTVFDSYVPVHLTSAVLPGTSPYERWSVSLGTVAFDLLLTVLISSLLRKRINIDWWRALHYLTYLAAPIAVLHVILLGTDAKKGSHWLLLVLAICVAAAAAAFVLRILRSRKLRGHTTAPPQRSAERLRPRSR